ncbi:MAG: hypothetical protein EHM42_14700, partial [Planctomycetaceae bacterium]
MQTLETRALLSATVLGDLIFDPTPANYPSGDEVDVGEITYEQAGDIVTVTYTIDALYQSAYDLVDIETTFNGTTLPVASFPAGTDSGFQTFDLMGADLESITACATTEVAFDIASFNASLPTVGYLRFADGTTVPPTSYFDLSVTLGSKPSATDATTDTMTFAVDPGLMTGDSVFVVAGFGAPATGLVTPPTATNATSLSDANTVTGGTQPYFVNRLNATTYSFHRTAADATTGANPVDITATETFLAGGCPSIVVVPSTFSEFLNG